MIHSNFSSKDAAIANLLSCQRTSRNTIGVEFSTCRQTPALRRPDNWEFCAAPSECLLT
jgi:hypothetical protein